MRRVLATLAVAALPALTAAPARAAAVEVGIVSPNTFDPPVVTAIVGDTLAWHNGTLVNHTVTATGFDSGVIAPGGGFFQAFPTAGTVHYVCTIHAFMAGDVNVVRLLLHGPSKPVARDAPLALGGRAAPGVTAVAIQADEGVGFRTVTSAAVHGGAFHATVSPHAPGVYRAAAGTDVSAPVRVRVTATSVLRLRPAGRRLRVVASPPRPRARVALQLRLRERFGWWTVARGRLDRRGRTSFPLPHRRGVRARVALVAPDGWTQLAVSQPIRLPRRRGG